VFRRDAAQGGASLAEDLWHRPVGSVNSCGFILFGFAAGCRLTGWAVERCGRGGREWRRHRSDWRAGV